MFVKRIPPAAYQQEIETKKQVATDLTPKSWTD